MNIDLEKDSLVDMLFCGVRPMYIYNLIENVKPVQKREKILKKFNKEPVQALSIQVDRNYHHMCLLANYLNEESNRIAHLGVKPSPRNS